MYKAQIQIMMLIVLGFFSGAAIAVEANIAVGLILCVLSIIGGGLGVWHYNKKNNKE
jgi:disulfide bond formation protein DsbB